MNDIIFSATAYQELMDWLTNDKKMFKKINSLIQDIQRQGALEGIGKPERLKGDLSGFYSRRIDEKNRLVYAVDGNSIKVVSCRGHYNDK